MSQRVGDGRVFVYCGDCGQELFWCHWDVYRQRYAEVYHQCSRRAKTRVRGAY